MRMPNQRGAKVIQVIHVETLEGEGTEKNVARLVHWYYSLDGSLLAIRDECPDTLEETDG